MSGDGRAPVLLTSAQETTTTALLADAAARCRMDVRTLTGPRALDALAGRAVHWYGGTTGCRPDHGPARYRAAGTAGRLAAIRHPHMIGHLHPTIRRCFERAAPGSGSVLSFQIVSIAIVSEPILLNRYCRSRGWLRMRRFVGRDRELRVLSAAFEEVREAAGSAKPGQCILMRGRRRVGKSSLVEEFLRRAEVPYVFFTAAGGPAEDELAELLDAVATSTLPERGLFAEEAPGQWNAAFRLLAEVLPDDTPSVVVIDEVPYLMDRIDAFEGMLQRAWDRLLSRKPVLLLLVGSDLSMMEALDSYDRPFHQRGREMIVGPLNPADIGEMLGLEPAAAFDAALVTGGLPLICAQWRAGGSLWEFLRDSLDNPISALLVSAERSLAAEFPPQAMSREVLRAIGTGERTFTNIARAAGGIAHTTLTRATDVLTEKRVVAAELPLSLRPSKERRYRVADPYLRFWLAFLDPHMAEIERMRGDLTLGRLKEQWTSWRGRAIEPLVRESLARLLPDGELPAAPAIGGYWTRSNDVEIDLVGADRQPVAEQLLFLGSVKWLENSTFDSHDLATLHKHRAAVTDNPVPLVAVSRSGISCSGLQAAYGPEELLSAWRRS